MLRDRHTYRGRPTPGRPRARNDPLAVTFGVIGIDLRDLRDWRDANAL
jgi:hypothetical protein